MSTKNGNDSEIARQESDTARRERGYLESEKAATIAKILNDSTDLQHKCAARLGYDAGWDAAIDVVYKLEADCRCGNIDPEHILKLKRKSD